MVERSVEEKFVLSVQLLGAVASLVLAIILFTQMSNQEYVRAQVQAVIESLVRTLGSLVGSKL